MKLIDDLFKHAKETVPYYQYIKNEFPHSVNSICDLQRLPLLTKELIQANQQNFISDKYNHHPLNAGLIIRRSSGADGKYIKAYWHNDENAQSELWDIRKSRYNISQTDKFAHFFTTQYITNSWLEPKSANLSSSGERLGFCTRNMDSNRLREIYDQLCGFNPAWLYFSSDIAQLFACYIKEEKLPPIPGLKYLECTGNYINQTRRNELEAAFGCPVAYQYNCSEANAIAFSDERGDVRRCLKSDVFVEILSDGKPVPEGETGDIYVTSLTNYAMPFIRFRTGYRGLLHNSDDDCQLLELVPSDNEFIQAYTGDRLPACVFLYPIEYINEKIGNIIRQFQIVQNDIDDFTVRMSIRPSYYGWREVISEEFVNNLPEKLLKNAKWKFEYEDKPFDNSTGEKQLYFINKLTNKGGA